MNAVPSSATDTTVRTSASGSCRLVSPVPSTVLAYQMGFEEDLLIARNGVAHPLFVQGVVRV